tara:strand:+ start:18453 stop:19250 length:798 start_codon:yes stop_codon:yes gene_type:complete
MKNEQSMEFRKPMLLKIGVMGGAGNEIPESYLQRATVLGEEIAIADCILVTGACPGLPLAAARGACSRGGMVIGISPALSLDEHAYHYGSPTLAHHVLIFTGSGLMGREVVNIRSSDMVVIVGGSSGTLGELAIAYDEGKLIGVLTGTGGVSDMVETILATCNKETGARVLYNDDPSQLIRELLEVYKSEHFRHPSVFCRENPNEPSLSDSEGQRDVVCGMMVPPGKAAARRKRIDGEFVFCSLSCAEKFDEQPTRYLESQTNDL